MEGGTTEKKPQTGNSSAGTDSEVAPAEGAECAGENRFSPSEGWCSGARLMLLRSHRFFNSGSEDRDHKERGHPPVDQGTPAWTRIQRHRAALCPTARAGCHRCVLNSGTARPRSYRPCGSAAPPPQEHPRRRCSSLSSAVPVPIVPPGLFPTRSLLRFKMKVTLSAPPSP